MILVVLSFFLVTCKSTDVTKNLSAEDRFSLGKKHFDDGEYTDAIAEFNVVKLQYSGSSVGDDAQYYLGECHYQQEEFLIAAEEYQTLRRSMPASPLVPMAQYKTAMCFYSLSPKSRLDQVYTKRAIDEFQAFIEYNPLHELAKDAAAKINELNTKLAKKLFDSGKLYVKMEEYKSAVIYFSSVIEKYHDTEYAEPSYVEKARVLLARRHFKEAYDEVNKFLQKFPNSTYKNEALSIQHDANEILLVSPTVRTP